MMLHEDEAFRALFARVMALGTAVEVVLFTRMAEMPPHIRAMTLQTIRNAGKDIGPAGSLHDVTAEFMADVRVRADEALGLLVDRVERMIADAEKGT